MTIASDNNPESKYLRDKIAKMSDREVTELNQRALVTLLFIYTDGTNEFDEETIEKYPNLAERNRIFSWTVGDYFILDLLKLGGYIEGESNRKSRWHKIFLTDRGLEKAQQLQSAFFADCSERIVPL